jgi:hypothetical protein
MRGAIRAIILTLLGLFAFATCDGQTPFEVNYDAVRGTVAFIYSKGGSGEAQPAGTAFLISVPSKANPSRSYILLVTARHMVDPGWLGCPENNRGLLARFNKARFDPKSAGVGTVDYDLSDSRWIMPADSVDIAYTVLNAATLKSLDAQANTVSLADFPKVGELKAIGTGAPILSAGLLPGASGKRRNYPVFKFGYVSSRPDETVTAKKACPGGREVELNEWMIAANLAPGNSGSPILYVPPRLAGGRPVLLGVQSIAFIPWDVAGMAPIQYLIDSLKSGGLPDLDVSEFDRPAPPHTGGTVVR